MCAWLRGARAVRNRPGFAAPRHFAGARAGGPGRGERPGGAAPGSPAKGLQGPLDPALATSPFTLNSALPLSLLVYGVLS